MFERKLTTLGTKNKKTLREFTGRKRMSENEYVLALEAYNTMVNDNKKIKKQLNKIFGDLPNYIEQNQEILKQKRKLYQDTQKQKNLKVNVKVDCVVKRTYKKNWVENGKYVGYIGDVENYNQTLIIEKVKRNDIEKTIIKLVSNDNSGYTDVLEKITKIEEFNKNDYVKKDKKKIQMKNAIILQNDWLRWSEYIAEKAYEKTDNKCVYNQLVTYLLDDKIGRANKFICGERMSEDALFEFFENTIRINQLDYPNFTKTSGVSTELIKYLCIELDRSMYAFDKDSKLFDSYVSRLGNYSPIIFYQLHGHFYLIDDHSIFKSIAKVSTENNTLVSSIIIQQQDKKPSKYEELPVILNIDWDCNNALDYESANYLVNKNNLIDYVIQLINKYNIEPNIKANDRQVIRFSYFNKNKEIVYISCNNTDKDCKYEEIKKVCDDNNIKYINEGIGSVITKLINKLFNPEDKTEEDNDEIKVDKNEWSSSFNNYCCENIVNNSYFKSWAFVEKVNEPLVEEKKITETEYIDALSIFGTQYKQINKKEKIYIIEKGTQKIDMVKCRRNILLNNEYKYPVYSVMDKPEVFNGDLRCGLYYVDTENVFPFRGSGWYLLPIIEYGLDNNIITKDNIKYEFKPSKTLPSNYFVKIVDYLLDKTKNTSMGKNIINSFVGICGRTKNTTTKINFTLDPYEASQYLTKNNNVFISQHKLECGDILYEVNECFDVIKDTDDYMIYKMILESEAIELHKLEQKIINAGGYIIDRNTDAIRFHHKHEIMFNDKWDNGSNKYQKEVAVPLLCERLPQMKRKPKELDNLILKWNIIPDTIDNFEIKAKELINKGISFNLNGNAGTGKSTLINELINQLKINNKKYIALSPTNKGALIINGTTIHKFYYRYSIRKDELLNNLRFIDYIFIDEISMMTEPFYQLFISIKKAVPSLRIILSGDFGQLPPVCDTWIGDYENSMGLFELCDGNKVLLTKCRRSDDVLYKLSLNVNSIDINQFPYKKFTWNNIAYTHETRKQINKMCMDKYLKSFPNRKSVEIKIGDTNNKIFDKCQDITLAVGMPVIGHKNNKKLGIINNQKYKVKKIDDNIIIENDIKEEISIDIKQFHRYLLLGFCITYHASQGDTFNDCYTIYNWKHMRVCNKAKYVAITRSTNINNIQIVA